MGTEGPHIEHALQQAEAMPIGRRRRRRQHLAVLKFLDPPTAHTHPVMVVATDNLHRNLR